MLQQRQVAIWKKSSIYLLLSGGNYETKSHIEQNNTRITENISMIQIEMSQYSPEASSACTCIAISVASEF